MKRALGLFCGISFVASAVNAQYIVDESYVAYQEPYVERSYGQQNWSYVTKPQSYQRIGYTNAYAQAQPSSYNYHPEYQQPDVLERTSPVFKRFYATLRAGVGVTDGWKKSEKAGDVKNPVGIIPSLSLGVYVTSRVRVDAEFAYHTKDKLYSGKDPYLEGKGKYSQYDFGLNAYYDFNTSLPFTPFVGVGIWGISSKINSTITDVYGDNRDTSRSKTNFAVSGALGLAYQVDNLITLEIMGRARYIFDEKIYNLEGLFGSRFRF